MSWPIFNFDIIWFMNNCRPSSCRGCPVEHSIPNLLNVCDEFNKKDFLYQVKCIFIQPGMDGLCGVGAAPDPVSMLLDQMLLLLSGRFHGQDGLSVLIMNHLQGDLRIPTLVLWAPKINLPALGHHHREVHVLAFPLHTVHRLHIGEVQLLDAGRLGRRTVLLQLFRRDEEQSFLGQQTALLLPQLQQTITPLLQHSLLHHLTAALQHPPENTESPTRGNARGRLGKLLRLWIPNRRMYRYVYH